MCHAESTKFSKGVVGPLTEHRHNSNAEMCLCQKANVLYMVEEDSSCKSRASSGKFFSSLLYHSAQLRCFIVMLGGGIHPELPLQSM